jgi:hypothetical protein
MHACKEMIPEQGTKGTAPVPQLDWEWFHQQTGKTGTSQGIG